MKYKANKKKLRIIIFLIIIILFFLLTLFILNNDFIDFENNIGTFILTFRNNNLTNKMLIITNISSAYFLIALSVILLISIKNKKIPITIVLNLICVAILSQITKMIFQRPRPLNINLITELGYSYPSGHSLISMSYYGFIAYLICKNTDKLLIKLLTIFLTLITTLLIGFSRIYLGVHYISDVLGGFLLAIIYLKIYITVITPYLEKK